MKASRLLLILVVLIAFMFFVPSAAKMLFGQGVHQHRGMHHLQVSDLVTMNGTVESVQTGRGKVECTHVTMKTGTETVEVHLAPAAFLKKNRMVIAKGDRIEVTGWRTIGTSEALIAREVKKDGKALRLPHAQGVLTCCIAPRT